MNLCPLIFLIDDDEDDKMLLQDALSRQIMAEFNGFSDGKAVLDSLHKTPVHLPDLIVLDLNMPVLSGFDFLKCAAGEQVLSQTPIVVFSTSHAVEDREKAGELGASDYIVKPCDLAGYDDVAGRLYNRWLRKLNYDRIQASAV